MTKHPVSFHTHTQTSNTFIMTYIIPPSKLLSLQGFCLPF